MDFWYFDRHELSSSFIRRTLGGPHGTPERIRVAELDISRFLHEVHARPRAREGKLLIKLDIEGKEIDVVPDLIEQDALCAADLVFIEWHTRIFKQAQSSTLARSRAVMRNASRAFAGMRKKGCKAKILAFDDET